MNKKLLIILSAIILLLVIAIGSYFFLLTPVSSESEEITFIINSGDSKEEITDNLKDANLIKSKYATLIYIIISGNNNLQAGAYSLNRNMSTKEIISSFQNGDVVAEGKESVSVTLKEGDTLKTYLEKICEVTNLDFDEAIANINDEEFLEDLIIDYWFLTSDILDDDIYYALEGYLYPNTYEFYVDTTLDVVIRKILDETDKNLSTIKEKIEDSSYSIHEILTMASIVEKEAVTYEDRRSVAQVIYTRLDLNMSLGMDVTSYYGVGKEMTDVITASDLADENPYNTRLTTFIGLPIGPICNPSLESIAATLDPTDTDYVYFFADVTTGEVYFTNSVSEFNEFKILYG